MRDARWLLDVRFVAPGMGTGSEVSWLAALSEVPSRPVERIIVEAGLSQNAVSWARGRNRDQETQAGNL